MKEYHTTSDAGASTAYVNCSVVCPMCGLAGTQYRLNPRQFWNSSREVDLQPNGYRFRGSAEKIHPPLLAMWHCMGCFFTAENGDFQAPLKDVLIRTETMALALKERMRTDNGFRCVAETLHADVRLNTIGFFQAVKLHLLAVRLWDEIGNLVKQDYMKQAQYSLLLAWLYRDLQTLDPERIQTEARLARLNAELRGHWPDLPDNEQAALNKAVGYYEASMARSTFCKDPLNEVSALHRIGRIKMKQKEYRQALETFRNSTALAQKAAFDMRRQLAIHGHMSGEDEVTGAAREAMVDRERRLLTLINDESRLVDIIRDTIATTRR